MADMAQPEDVYDAWDDLSEVVDTERVIPITYMNSAASLKAFVGKNGGAVCTSSNATAVLEWAFEQGDQVLFFPDQHLGRNTGKRLGIDPKTQTTVWSPRKINGGLTEERIEQSKILLWQGHCSVHIRFRVDQIERAREEHPGVQVVVHPECTQQVVDAADADGSTEFIINYVRNGPPGTCTRSAPRSTSSTGSTKRSPTKARPPSASIRSSALAPRCTASTLHTSPGSPSHWSKAAWSTRSRSTTTPASGPASRSTACWQSPRRAGRDPMHVLVIGSGLAGINAALLASEFADVTLLNKSALEETNTNRAQGGIAAAITALDHPSVPRPGHHPSRRRTLRSASRQRSHSRRRSRNRPFAPARSQLRPSPGRPTRTRD